MYFNELLSESRYSKKLNLANILKEQKLFDDFLKDKSQAERSKIIQAKLLEVDMKDIKHVDLTGNSLDIIPEFIFHIPNLVTLILKRNKIRIISEKIKLLKRLETLDLSENSFVDFPTSILSISNLKNLNLQLNNISCLPDKIDELFNLEHFSIYANNLEALPKSLLNIDNLKEFEFHSNDIKVIFDKPIETIPAEIYNQGIRGINAYLLSIDGKSVEKSYEAKLVIIGNSGVGKTTLIENLLNESYGTLSHSSTHGVEVREWMIDGEHLGLERDVTFKLNVWDFGGQGVYRELQQFFCSQNTFYIYVTCSNKEISRDKYTTDSYWLSSIRSLSYNPMTNHYSPIICVINKCDQENGLNRSIQENLLHQFKESIVDMQEVSCKKGKGIKELRASIFRNINRINIENAPLADTISNNWFNLKNNILRLKKGRKAILTKREYEQLYREHKLEKNEAEALLKFMHSTGMLVYFETNSELRWFILLEVKVLLEVTHKLYFNLPSQQRNNGIITIDDFEELVHGVNMEWDRLLYFLKWFNIIHEVEEKSGKYLIPPLLPTRTANIPEYLEKNDRSVNITYNFNPFIPASLFYKILTKNYELIDNAKISSSVIIFSYKGDKVVLEENWKENTLLLKGMSTSSCLEFMLQIQFDIFVCFNTICKSKNMKNYNMGGRESLKQLIRLNQTIPKDEIDKIKSRLLGKSRPDNKLSMNEANMLEGDISKGLLSQVINKLVERWKGCGIIGELRREYEQLYSGRNISLTITRDVYEARMNALGQVLVEIIKEYTEKV